MSTSSSPVGSAVAFSRSHSLRSQPGMISAPAAAISPREHRNVGRWAMRPDPRDPPLPGRPLLGQGRLPEPGRRRRASAHGPASDRAPGSASDARGGDACGKVASENRPCRLTGEATTGSLIGEVGARGRRGSKPRTPCRQTPGRRCSTPRLAESGSSPVSTRNATGICRRRLTPSFERNVSECAFAVRGEMPSRSPTSSFEHPAAISATTSRCRDVRSDSLWNA